MIRFINERPVVIFGSLLAIGIAIGNEFLFNNILYIYAAVITAAALILVLIKRLRFKVLLYCLAFCIGVFSITFTKGTLVSNQNNFYVGSTKCSIYVSSVSKDDSIHIIADKVTVNGKKYDGKVSLYLYDTERFKIEAGQTIELTAKFYKPKAQTNPYGFDYNFYLQQDGIVMSASADAGTCALIKEEALGLLGVFSGARDSIENKIAALYGDNSGLIKGILLGDKTEIDETVLTNFRDSGLAHILAISGLHIGFIVAFLLYLLRLLKLKEKKIIFLIAIILLGYCAVTGFSPSIVRASIMAVFVLGAKIVGKRQDTLTSLFAAGIVILLLNPFSLFKVGFQLSFCAVLGILLLMESCSKLFSRLPKRIRDTLAVSISAQSGIFLVSAYYFYNATIYSTIANILVMPIIGLLVVLAFASVAIGFIANIIAMPLVFIVNILLSVLTGITSFVSALPYASITIGQPPLYMIAAVFIILFIVSKYAMISNYKKLISSLIVVILLLGCVIYNKCTAFNGLKIIVFDVGQGDSAYIQTPGGYNILIDGGPLTDSYDVGESVLLPYFYGSSTRDIDILIASHSHSDHVGGLISVAQKLNVINYIEPSDIQSIDEDVAYKQLKTVLNDKGVVSKSESAGDTIELSDGVKLEILYPIDDIGTDDNERALVVKISYNNFSMVFTSDIDSNIESEISKNVGSVNVLKVAHHGSKYSSSQDFLSQTTPQTAIISVGVNSYGHPTQEALNRLSDIGANIYRTDTQGAVIIKVYDDKYTVESMIN